MSRHGTNAGYVAGCRDSCCRTPHADYQRRLWRRRYARRVNSMLVDSIGSVRRVRALQAIGWTMPELDAYLGVKGAAANVVNGRGRLHVDRAAAVAEMYHRLARVPRSGWVADRTIRRARRNGWPSPIAWADIDHPDFRNAVGLASSGSVPSGWVDVA